MNHKVFKKLNGVFIRISFQFECAELEIKISDQMRELYNDYRILEKQEKQAVRRIHFEVIKHWKVKLTVTQSATITGCPQIEYLSIRIQPFHSVHSINTGVKINYSEPKLFGPNGPPLFLLGDNNLGLE